MTTTPARINSLIAKLKNHPVIAVMLVIASGIIGLSTFTDASRNLLGLLDPSRPAINGQWQAQITYPWGTNQSFVERFQFKGTDKILTGTASVHNHSRLITEGQVTGDEISFVIRIQSITGETSTATSYYHYRATLKDDQLRFELHNDTGGAGSEPVVFVAKQLHPTNEPREINNP